MHLAKKKRTKNLVKRLLMATGIAAASGVAGSAETFETDFNFGIVGGLLYGSAVGYDHSTGGVDNSGVLKLTTNVNDQQSSFVIDDFDFGNLVAGFDAQFKMRIGGGSGTPADGVSFVWGTGVPNGVWGEEGPTTVQGLTVVFDIYNNSGGEAPAIDLKWNNVEVATRKFPIATLRSGAEFWDVHIHLDEDGTLDVTYNNQVIYENFQLQKPLIPKGGARFGFGARTGGLNENIWVDNLSITTFAPSGPYIQAISPQGANGHPEGIVYIEIVDVGTEINPDSIEVDIDGTDVAVTTSKEGGVTTVIGNLEGILPPNTDHVLNLTYADNSSTPVVNNSSYNFSVGAYPTIPAELAQEGVDTTKPGFTTRVYQMAVSRTPGDPNTIGAAERALAGGYIDPATGLPLEDVKDPAMFNEDGFYVDEDVLNWSQNAGADGVFRATSTEFPVADEHVPGIPGLTFSDDNYVTETWTYLDLKAGAYRFSVNSDDGFRLSTARGARDVLGQVVGSFNGGRGSSTTAPQTFDFAVAEDGIYPFRLSWWEGGGGSNIEFFMVDPATAKYVLINAEEAPVKAYRESAITRPSVLRVRPEPLQNFTMPDADIIIDIADGTIPVNAGSIVVKIDGNEIEGTLSTADGVTTFLREGSAATLLSAGSHTAEVSYEITEGGAPVTVTGTWTFNVLQHGVLSTATRVEAAQVPTAGFTANVHQLHRTANTTTGDSDRFPGDGNRMPRPEVQFAEGYIDTNTGEPFPNAAVPDLNDGDFTYEIWNVLNFSSAVTDGFYTAPNAGLFNPNDPMPGLGTLGEAARTTMANNGLDNYVAEFTTYLKLEAGSYMFAVNSDDGFVASSAADVNDTLGTMLGFFNGGRGASSPLPQPTANPNPTPGSNTGNSVFAAVVPEAGIYPFRILYWQGGGGVNMEFLSINTLNGQQVLVNDTANGGIEAFTGYTGPERAHVVGQVSPTPWDNRIQQSVPGQLFFYGRTPNSVDATDLYNNADADRPWADVAIGAVIANGAGKDITLLLDGEEVEPTLTTEGSTVTVTYRPNPALAPGSSHTATLIYDGVTGSWPFTVQNYVAVEADSALPISAADPEASGFLVKIAHSATARGDGNNTVVAAEKQLTGTPADVSTPNPDREDGRYITEIVNYNNNFNVGGNSAPIGNFQDSALAGWPFTEYADKPFPGLDSTLSGALGRENFTAEIFAYLQFDEAGYYRLGVNGDDGWAVTVATPGQTDGQVLFTMNRGGGAVDFPFSFTVPEAGLYPIRLLFYQGGGGASVEFFSYDEEQTGVKIPVNDRTNPKAIKAYYAVEGGPGDEPEITITADGENINITWTNGGTLQGSPVAAGTGVDWQDLDSDGTYTTTAEGDAMFFRVVRQD